MMRVGWRYIDIEIYTIQRAGCGWLWCDKRRVVDKNVVFSLRILEVWIIFD